MTQLDSSGQYWVPWMRRALELAALAEGSTSPNPQVGAIILDKNEQIVGEGFHFRAGEAHAEVEALSQAGERAKGGTLLVTLEPCCHEGRTPPCTKAILEAGLSRVVIGLEDPDPRVSGKGISLLRKAGIEVLVGVLEKEALYQNRSFVFRVKTGRPWGILKWAMSFDGRIGLSNGASKWISGKKARERIYKLRAKCDAVIIGGGTLRADNPLLTTRGKVNPEPLRVVFTSGSELPKQARLWNTDLAETVIAYGPGCNSSLLLELPEGPSLLKLNSNDPLELLNALAEKKGVNTVLWECGGSLAKSAIERKCVQELVISLSPKLLGGDFAMTPLADFGFESMEQVLALSNVSLFKEENDFFLSMAIEGQSNY